jgi:hypothetical protein
MVFIIHIIYIFGKLVYRFYWYYFYIWQTHTQGSPNHGLTIKIFNDFADLSLAGSHGIVDLVKLVGLFANNTQVRWSGTTTWFGTSEQQHFSVLKCTP